MISEKDVELFIAWLKKMLKIQSPSALICGYTYMYDYLKSEERNNMDEEE